MAGQYDPDTPIPTPSITVTTNNNGGATCPYDDDVPATVTSSMLHRVESPTAFPGSPSASSGACIGVYDDLVIPQSDTTTPPVTSVTTGVSSSGGIMYDVDSNSAVPSGLGAGCMYDANIPSRSSTGNSFLSPRGLSPRGADSGIYDDDIATSSSPAKANSPVVPANEVTTKVEPAPSPIDAKVAKPEPTAANTVKITPTVSVTPSPTEEMTTAPHTIWNKRFQDALNQLEQCKRERHSHTLTHHEALVRAWTAIRDVSVDFVYAAQSYGKIIIGEKFLSLKEKSILPTDVGGYAGGEKFKINGILFKFARDDKGIFNGDDDLAAKAAGHELKSCVRFFEASDSKIRVPLMATVDYLGYRLTACSVIPISSSTLVYGSSDGGEIVKNNDPVAYKAMEEICKTLNLKKHKCGKLNPKTNKPLRPLQDLYGPTDVEIHKGTDNGYYVLDMARLFPPEKTVPGVPGCYLHRLLRPELVRTYKKPLSSDAFSRFGKSDENEEASNQDIIDISDELHQTVIPDFAKSLDAENASIKPSDPLSLSFVPKMHASGINARHLGEVWKLSKQESVKAVLTTEIASRAIKANLRKKLRELMAEERKLSQTPFCRLIVDYLNTIFNRIAFSRDAVRGPDAQKQQRAMLDAWQNEIHPRMVSQYSGYDASWMKSMEIVDQMGVYLRLKEMMGLEFSPVAVTKFFEKKEQGFSLYEHDLLSIPLKITHMDLFSIAEGHLLALNASKQTSSVASQFLEWSIDRFYHVIAANPTSHNHFFQLGMSQLQLATRKASLPLFSEARANFARAELLNVFSTPKYTAAQTICTTAQSYVDLKDRCFSYTPKGIITSVYAVDKETIILGRKDGNIEKIKTNTGRKMGSGGRIYELHKGAVTGLAQLGKNFVSICYDRHIKIWQRKKKAVLLSETRIEFVPRCLHVVGNKLLIGGGERETPAGSLSLFSIDSSYNFTHLDFNGHVGCVWSCTASTLRNIVVSGGSDGLRLWDLSGTMLAHSSVYPLESIQEAARARVMKISTLEGTDPIPASGIMDVIKVNCVALRNSIGEIVAGYEDGSIRLFRINIHKTPTSKSKLPPDSIKPDKSSNMSVILQTNYELELIALLVGHASAVTCMQLIGSDSAPSSSSSQGDGLLVTGSTDGTLRVWDLTQTQLRLCVRVVEDGAVWALSSVILAAPPHPHPQHQHPHLRAVSKLVSSTATTALDSASSIGALPTPVGGSGSGSGSSSSSSLSPFSIGSSGSSSSSSSSSSGSSLIPASGDELAVVTCSDRELRVYCCHGIVMSAPAYSSATTLLSTGSALASMSGVF
ncbi:Histidine kinase [Pelomyxa schiedti]|nr:Histidine kinase [Pelomyxa schiedti]